jgi:hypothetical protein
MKNLTHLSESCDRFRCARQNMSRIKEIFTETQTVALDEAALHINGICATFYIPGC